MRDLVSGITRTDKLQRFSTTAGKPNVLRQSIDSGIVHKRTKYDSLYSKIIFSGLKSFFDFYSNNLSNRLKYAALEFKEYL